MATKKDINNMFSIEAEQSLLGCILLDENVCDDIFSKVVEEDFYISANSIIFAKMKELFNSGKIIDFVTLVDAIECSGLMPSVGNVDYIALLTNITPSASNYTQYIKIVLKHSKQRKVVEGYKKIINNIEKKSIDEIQTETTNLLENVLNDNSLKEIVHISSFTNNGLQNIMDIMNGTKKSNGLYTGFELLDDNTTGFYGGNLIIVGGRAGTGKTAWALNVIDYVANTLKKNTLFFSLEMPQNEIVRRLYSIKSGVENWKLKKGYLQDFDLKKINAAKESMDNGKLFIDDEQNTVPQMITKAKKLKRQQGGLDLIVVDYLQFVKPTDPNANRFQQVGEIAKDLKRMARQLNCPVIALTQLSRRLDTETDRRPTLSDLRESGEIENNADIVFFLYRDGSFTFDEPIQKIKFEIGKFRDGELLVFNLNYEGAKFRFSEVVKEGKLKPKTEQLELKKVVISDDELPF